jgi:hypothetical protein
MLNYLIIIGKNTSLIEGSSRFIQILRGKRYRREVRAES